MIETLLNGYRCVIALDCKGAIEVPIRKGVPLIAADGASRWFDADTVVGDGDSSNSDGLVRIADQDTTDFEKCIGYARDNTLLPALVVGVGGGEIDHVLGNVQVMMKHSSDQSLFFLDPYPGGMKIGIPLEKGGHRLSVRNKATVSLLPFGSCVLSTEGLVWELSHQTLVPEGLLAIRNEAKGDEIAFTLEKGKVLVVIDL